VLVSKRSPWTSRLVVVGVVVAAWAALWFTRPSTLGQPHLTTRATPVTAVGGVAPIVAGDSTFCAGWSVVSQVKLRHYRLVLYRVLAEPDVRAAQLPRRESERAARSVLHVRR
jgi:hypothetical protein